MESSREFGRVRVTVRGHIRHDYGRTWACVVVDFDGLEEDGKNRAAFPQLECDKKGAALAGYPAEALEWAAAESRRVQKALETH